MVRIRRRLCGIKNYFSEKSYIFQDPFNPLKVSQIFSVHVSCLFGGFVEGVSGGTGKHQWAALRAVAVELHVNTVT